MLIDGKKIESARENLTAKSDLLVSQIKRELGIIDPNFNIDSGVQLGRLLAEKGWPCVHKAKDGYYLTNDFCLQRWSSLGFKTADKIMDYRGIKTLLKTYVGNPEVRSSNSEYVQYDFDGTEIETGKVTPASGYYQYLRYHDDGTIRVHPTFWAMLADSLRNKCSDPNLQNVPKRGENAELIRAYFTVPGPDWLFGEWDAAGLQLRIAGIISGDHEMRKAFMDPVIKGDLHSVTAHAVFKKDITLEEFLKRYRAGDKELKALRQKAKACFPAGTEILTNGGWIRVEDFIPAVNLEQHTPYGGHLLAVDPDGGTEVIESTYYAESSEFVDFELANGDVVTVTPDHQMIVIRFGEEIRVEAKDVLLTDEIPLVNF